MTDAQQPHDHGDDNRLIAQRREKLAAIRQQRNAFPNDFRRDAVAADLHARFEPLSREELETRAQQVAVAGRIIRMRGPFLVIQDGSGQMQLYLNNKTMTTAQQAELDLLDLGDIIGVEGEVFKTGKGELTVRAAQFRLLTKSLRPLPDKYRGLADTEVRYRQRYVDLIVNEESRRVFILRSRIVNFLRSYFEEPTLYHPSQCTGSADVPAGGAGAVSQASGGGRFRTRV
jgi:lysyl-tRNA synthetase class 2